jgi:ABC-2 type transporter
MGLFFFILALFGFSTLTSLNIFATERILFVRERANGYYSPITYFAAKVVFPESSDTGYFRYHSPPSSTSHCNGSNHLSNGRFSLWITRVRVFPISPSPFQSHFSGNMSLHWHHIPRIWCCKSHRKSCNAIQFAICWTFTQSWYSIAKKY